MIQKRDIKYIIFFTVVIVFFTAMVATGWYYADKEKLKRERLNSH